MIVMHVSSPHLLAVPIQRQIISNSHMATITTLELSPHDVDPAKYGHHASIVLQDQWRAWLLSSWDNRQLFDNDFRRYLK